MHFGPTARLYVAVGDNALATTRSHSTTCSARCCGSTRTDRSRRQPVRHPAHRRQRRDLGDRPAQSVHLLHRSGVSGKMFINDVGQNTWKRSTKASRARITAGPPPKVRRRTLPTDRRSTGIRTAWPAVTGCAITGGTFYSGVQQIFPASYAGDYFFADYCSGWINQLNEAHTRVTPTFATEVAAFPVDLKAGPDGARCITCRASAAARPALSGASCSPDRRRRQSARTRRTSRPPSGSPRPSRSSHLARPRSRINGRGMAPRSPGERVDLHAVERRGQRQRQPVPRRRLERTGIDHERPGNAHGHWKLRRSDDPRRRHLQIPAGTMLNFSGSATDPEQGTLLPGTATWVIDFHHDTHEHPALAFATGASGLPDI